MVFFYHGQGFTDEIGIRIRDISPGAIRQRAPEMESNLAFAPFEFVKKVSIVIRLGYVKPHFGKRGLGLGEVEKALFLEADFDTERHMYPVYQTGA